MRVASHFSEQELQRRVDREPRADGAKRLRAVLLAMQGLTAPEIATCTGFCRRSVQAWIERYNREGLDGLKTRSGRGRKPPLTPEQAEQLQQRLDAGPRPEDGVCTLRGKDVQRILAREFGQIRSLNAVYGLLHHLGYSSLAPRPQHPRADPAAQEAFQNNFANQLAEIQAKYPDRRVEVYFEDEARFGQQGTLTRVWARTGSRPRAVRQTQYGYVYVLAVACAETGHAEGLIAPFLDTSIVNVFLKQFAATLPPDVQAVVVWDGAGYHRSGELDCPPNLTLVDLPPYSPELNPIENLWHYLRSHYWSNREYESVEALFAAAEAAWKAACLDEATIRTVCHTPYAQTRS